MKKYNTPELTISSFDVEDVITTSGEYVTGIDTYANFTTDNSVGGAQQVYATGAYFAWDAH